MINQSFVLGDDASDAAPFAALFGQAAADAFHLECATRGDDALSRPGTGGPRVARGAQGATANARAEITLNSISDAIICTDTDGRVDYLNLAAEQITGWTRQQAYGHAISEVFNIINGVTRAPAPNPLTLVLQGMASPALPFNTILIRKDGHEFAIEDSASPIHDWDGQLVGGVIVFHDVGTTRAMAIKMAHLAQHDFLTDLPNRILFNDRLKQAIHLEKRNHGQIVLMFIDLDHFKCINDQLGHAHGDQLLCCVAQRLSDCVRKSDTVSRHGGDEFLILMNEIRQDEDAGLTADKIRAALALPYVIDGNVVRVTASIGISTYPRDGSNADELIKCADTAMYGAKDRGGNAYRFFSTYKRRKA